MSAFIVKAKSGNEYLVVDTVYRHKEAVFVGVEPGGAGKFVFLDPDDCIFLGFTPTPVLMNLDQRPQQAQPGPRLVVPH